MLFGPAKASLFETENFLELLTPRDSVGRQVELPNAHPAALHSEGEHRLILMDGFLDAFPFGNIANDPRCADDIPFGIPDWRDGQRNDDVGPITPPANCF